VIRLHLSEDRRPDSAVLADVLRAVADDIALGGRSGETILESWVGRDIDFGLPIVIEAGETRYVNWSLTFD
jgi:hypothetical protein